MHIFIRGSNGPKIISLKFGPTRKIRARLLEPCFYLSINAYFSCNYFTKNAEPTKAYICQQFPSWESRLSAFRLFGSFPANVDRICWLGTLSESLLVIWRKKTISYWSVSSEGDFSECQILGGRLRRVENYEKCSERRNIVTAKSFWPLDSLSGW